MLLQALSELIKDMARALGHDIAEVKHEPGAYRPLYVCLDDVDAYQRATCFGAIGALQRLQRSPYGVPADRTFRSQRR